MIKLFSVKQKQREAAESANGRTPVKKQSAGELRVQKGACALDSVIFPCVSQVWEFGLRAVHASVFAKAFF